MRELRSAALIACWFPARRDETGFGDSQYDFKLEYTPEAPVNVAPGETPPPSDGPSIFTALTEQLGLRLEPHKGPVPVYVIEKIRKPSEN